MAIPMVVPVAGERMVAMARFKRFIFRQRLNEGNQDSIQRFGVLSFLLPFIVALELPRALNRPRSGPP